MPTHFNPTRILFGLILFWITAIPHAKADFIEDRDKAYVDDLYLEDRKIQALKQCLIHNYEALGLYKADPKIIDDTIWTLPIGRDEGQFSFEGITALRAFVAEKTSHYYQTDYRGQYHMESYDGTVRHVFINCYRFHQSAELEAFLKATAP